MEQNEDEIIAEAFIKIKDGVLARDWAKIVSAYKDITGEDLEIPEEKPKSRLDAIRSKISEKTEKPAKKPRKPKAEKKPKEAPKPDIDDDNSLIKEISEKGGQRFAREGFKVITIPFNDEEAEKNKLLAKKTPKMKRMAGVRPDPTKKFDTTNPNREIGYSENPSHPDPRR